MKALREILRSIERLPSVWLFLPREESWTLDCGALVAAMDEVPPEEEDLDDAGYPEAARIMNFMAALPIRTVEETVLNAREQRPKATDEELLKAFLHYYDHDAFIDFSPPQEDGA